MISSNHSALSFHWCSDIGYLCHCISGSSVQNDCWEQEDERGKEDQELKGKCSEKGCPYEYVCDVICETCRQPPKWHDGFWGKLPSLLQVLISLSTDIIKESYQHLGGKMGEFPDLKKRTVAEAILQKWGERIWVMGSDAIVSWKWIVQWQSENWHDHSSNYT